MSPRSRKYRQNKTAKLLIGFVIAMLLFVVGFKSVELREKRDYYAQREQQLVKEIESEQARAVEIAEYETYTQTKAYIEEIARDKLGLVYEGEILFKDEN